MENILARPTLSVISSSSSLNFKEARIFNCSLDLRLYSLKLHRTERRQEIRPQRTYQSWTDGVYLAVSWIRQQWKLGALRQDEA